MIGITHRVITVASIIKMNNAAIRRGYNRAIDWDYYGDANEQLRDRLALFRPCIIDIAVSVHGVDGAGEFHHRCRVMLPVEDNGFVTAYLDVSDNDYRTVIVQDVARMLELEFPSFADDPLECGLPLAKRKMLDESFALFDEYDTLGDERE